MRLVCVFVVLGMSKICLIGGEFSLCKDLDEIIVIVVVVLGICKVVIIINGMLLLWCLLGWYWVGLIVLNVSMDSL